MFGSITFRALGTHARRIVDFLLYEHASHGGRENGNLAAPYEQLGPWGVTATDVRRGLEELFATGFVGLVQPGICVDINGGGGEPARYALTWLPTLAGSGAEESATHDWKTVPGQLGRKRIGNVSAARRWLRDETAGKRRGWLKAERPAAEKRPLTPHLQVVPPITCEAGGGRK